MDYVNSALDMGYSLLFSFVDSLLESYGFDVYCGVLHRQFYMRKSLVCDLVEPFRPLIDLQVRKSLNLGQCREEDFEVIQSRYVLKWKNSPRYTKFLCQNVLKRKSEIYEYVQNYYRCVMRQKNSIEYPTYILK